MHSQPDLIRTVSQSPVEADTLLESGSPLLHSDGIGLQEAILDRLRALQPGETLLVDLAPLHQASYSMLRDLFLVAVILRTRELENRYVLYRVDDTDVELIDTLEVIARDRREVLPAINTEGCWRTFGRLAKAERDTLGVVLEAQEITTAQLCVQMSLMPSAASNRLRRLYALRIVKRIERLLRGRGGREFVYQSLCCPNVPNCT
jgi:hypothetical protein